MKRTIVLAILDGFGIGRNDPSNPLFVAPPKNLTYIKNNFPSGSLQSAGIAVGLPWGEEGNSEVGHLTIGAGKVIYQHFPRISLAIRDGSFFMNEPLKNAFAHAKKNNSRVHIVGLLTQGNVHASLDHLLALIKMATEEAALERLDLHLFSDGKDSPPQSALSLLKQIPNVDVLLASLTGREFGLDRDKHWDRTEKAYQALTGQVEPVADYHAVIRDAYAQNPSDQFLPPVLIQRDKAIKSNDAVIFLDFREDSVRQLTGAFVLKDFEEFKIVPLENMYYVTMTQYTEKYSVPVAFPAEKVENPLGKVLSDAGKTQMRIAETEKYAHVTFFFNGYKDLPFKSENRVLIPSHGAVHHDENPEMMAEEITGRVQRAIEEGGYDFILVNYANPDMIAHTGNFDAAIKAVEVVDAMIARLRDTLFKYHGILLITSDHGNVERMRDPLTGKTETNHDPNPVPIYLVVKELERPRNEEEIAENEKFPIGLLSDVAPTILELMGIQKPKEMTGQSLMKLLR